MSRQTRSRARRQTRTPVFRSRPAAFVLTSPFLDCLDILDKPTVLSGFSCPGAMLARRHARHQLNNLPVLSRGQPTEHSPESQVRLGLDGSFPYPLPYGQSAPHNSASLTSRNLTELTEQTEHVFGSDPDLRPLLKLDRTQKPTESNCSL